jgi:hypothetical protein
MIPEAVAMETTTVEAELFVPAIGVMEGTTPELGAMVAPKDTMEKHVDAHPGASTEVVVCEPEVHDAAPIRSTPVAEAMSTSRGDLELLADDLVDPAIVARNMESMHHAEQWIKVCRGYHE